MRIASVAVLLIIGSLFVPGPGGAQDILAPARAPFIVEFGEQSTSYHVLGVYVTPGEKLPLAAYPLTVSDEYLLSATAGAVVRQGPNRWTWTAPRVAGLYPLEIRPAGAYSGVTLNAFVIVPFAALRHGRVHGYTVGSYPSPRASASHSERYQNPRGFIEVTRETENAQVSPHFRLGQFVTRQGGRYPRYLVLREVLLMKLEAILEEARRRGVPAQTFTIMSGYRTPAYNHGLGNVQLSRHQFGDASDIFVDDQPRDGVMDDLNHDGHVDVGDAVTLSQIADWVSVRPGNEKFVGGLGVYTNAEGHGPFVHVDVRGFPARWSGEGVALDGHAPEPETAAPSSFPTSSPLGERVLQYGSRQLREAPFTPGFGP
jgi:Peptidase M15